MKTKKYLVTAKVTHKELGTRHEISKVYETKNAIEAEFDFCTDFIETGLNVLAEPTTVRCKVYKPEVVFEAE